jgi:hypothetical protein
LNTAIRGWRCQKRRQYTERGWDTEKSKKDTGENEGETSMGIQRNQRSWIDFGTQNKKHYGDSPPNAPQSANPLHITDREERHVDPTQNRSTKNGHANQFPHNIAQNETKNFNKILGKDWKKKIYMESRERRIWGWMAWSEWK